MYNLNTIKQFTLQPDSDWWPRCEFIRGYFIGPQKIIAQELATYFAEEFVGDGITNLRPDTDISLLVAQAIANKLTRVEASIQLEEIVDEYKLTSPVEFKDLVRAVQTERYGQ